MNNNNTLFENQKIAMLQSDTLREYRAIVSLLRRLKPKMVSAISQGNFTIIDQGDMIVITINDFMATEFTVSI